MRREVIGEFSAQAELDEALVGVSNQGFVKLSLSGMLKRAYFTIIQGLFAAFTFAHSAVAPAADPALARKR
jgi:hypothetical protein